MAKHLVTQEQARVYDTLKAMLMFQDGGNFRIPDEREHDLVIAFVLTNMHRELLVRYLIQRDITTYAEIVAAVAAADKHHASVQDGIL